MPVSNSTVLPASGLASKARQARSMRLAPSTVAQRSHSARGALPNIAPPSSFCELPRIDQSFMSFIPVLAGGACKANVAGVVRSRARNLRRSDGHTNPWPSIVLHLGGGGGAVSVGASAAAPFRRHRAHRLRRGRGTLPARRLLLLRGEQGPAGRSRGQGPRDVRGIRWLGRQARDVQPGPAVAAWRRRAARRTARAED